MTWIRLLVRSVTYRWRSACAVAAAVLVCTAVLTGSLVVGDSVRGSLEQGAVTRLCGADLAILSPDAFPADLSTRLEAELARRGMRGECAPVIRLTGSVRSGYGARAGHVNVLGVDARFWRMAGAPENVRHARVNATLGEALGALAGRELVVSFAREPAAPARSLFAHRSREETVASLRVTVRDVVPAALGGEFQLENDTRAPRNLFVPIDTLQQRLGRAGANTILVALRPGGGREAPGAAAAGRVEEALRAAMVPADHGLSVTACRDGSLAVRSDRIVLGERLLDALRAPLAAECGVRRVSVHLANGLWVRGRAGPSIPYSIVQALEEGPGPSLPVASGRAGVPGPGEISLNAWAADQLRARIGDTIELEHFSSDATATTTLALRLRSVVGMSGLAVEPALVPDFGGITDVASMGSWRAPFPVDASRIRPADEAYWSRWRTTPKAFVALDTVRAMWGAGGSSGWVTGLLLSPSRPGPAWADRAREVVRGSAPPSARGLAVRSIRAEALAAARGSTEFGLLFLGMGCFLIAAAACLAGFLTRLELERRSGQTGMLRAMGFSGRATAGLAAAEGMAVAAAGVIVGVPAGIGYASMLIRGLTTSWAGAMSGARLAVHVEPASLAAGAGLTLSLALGAIRWACRDQLRARVPELLAGSRPSIAGGSAPGRWPRAASAVSLAAAALATALAISGAVPVVPAFFVTGACVLVGLVLAGSGILARPPDRTRGDLTWPRLVHRWLAASATRTLVTVGLLASASFVIAAVAANRCDLERADTSRFDSGAGGFTLSATSDVPVYADLGTDDGRRAAGVSARARELLRRCRVVGCRATQGDEASCLNVQRPVVPRVRGVPGALIERGGFSFAALDRSLGPLPANPWKLLERPLPDGRIPAFVDAGTAQWILKVGPGDAIDLPGPASARLRVVGLLDQSLFASELVVAGAAFVETFGSSGGFRSFLIEAPAGIAGEVARLLSADLADLGFEVEPTGRVLARYLEVQNAYLAAFETLGGLGLLLGTLGVVTLLLGSVADRRREIAMLLAMGFSRGRIALAIAAENALAIVAGVAAGLIGALVATAPQLARTVAAVRWGSLATTLSACVAAGVLSCWLAAVLSVRNELVVTLRSE